MIYGNTFLKEEYGYITEGAIKDFFKNQKVPNEIKLTNVNDFRSASTFKAKTTKLLKYFKDENWSEKAIAKAIYMWYFGIVGCEFSEGIDRKEKYQPKMQYYTSLVLKYCNDKQKEKLKKDMENTIVDINKREKKTDLQKAWLSDIKSVVNKY